MMQRAETTQAQADQWAGGSNSNKRASGLFTVWRWLRGGALDESPTPLSSSSASRCSSPADSDSSLASSDTADSFSWVRPAQYRAAASTSSGGSSLPLPMTRRADERSGGSGTLHRRAASESARLHVRGKRRAPQPPHVPAITHNHCDSHTASARRKKRMAPQPPVLEPDVISNDTLRLERGVLRPAKQQEPQEQEQQQQLPQQLPQVQKPRPWYKRGKGDQDKRRSCNMSFLTNISELDRQTMQILERETLKLKYLRTQSQPAAPAFMQARQESTQAAPPVASGSPRPRSARDLIARFNAITARAGVREIRPSTVAPPQPVVTTPPPSSPAATRPSRNPWLCPRCTCHNDYWRIICRVCSAIKPYFDDFTTASTPTTPTHRLEASPVTHNEISIFGKQIFEKLPTNKINGEKTPVQPANPFKFNFDRLEQTSKMNKEDRDIVLSKSQGAATATKQEIANEPERNTHQNILDKTTKEFTQTEKLSPKFEIKDNKINKINLTGKNIEKIILGDEIKVEKPHYMNESPKIKNKERQMKILESMNFGNGIIENDNENENDDATKKEERDKLKKMLIEMKNSLSKRSVNKMKEEERANRVSMVQEEEASGVAEPTDSTSPVELIVVTQQTTYENVRVRRTDGEEGDVKPMKVSSWAQTGGASGARRREATDEEIRAIKATAADYQLIGENEWSGRVEQRRQQEEQEQKAHEQKEQWEQEQHTYSNVAHVNRLLRELEESIGGGKLERAAAIASELAQLKVPCSVIRQSSQRKVEQNEQNTPSTSFIASAPIAGAADDYITVDVYVEDRSSTGGPFPVRIRKNSTVGDLRAQAEKTLSLPQHVQRWILGRRLATDDSATLADHDITQSGCPVYLYLVQPLPEQGEQPPAEVKMKEEERANIVEEEEGAAAAAALVPMTPVLDHKTWTCRACTLVNEGGAKECGACGTVPAATSTVPADTYHRLVNLDNDVDLVANAESFECLVCLCRCDVGAGCVLRDCLHQFCRDCLAQAVDLSDEPAVICPYRDADYSCHERLQEREVRALVTEEAYEKHLARSVRHAERQLRDAYHCRTQDCAGWCTYDEDVNEFACPVCGAKNCLTCQAVHAPLDCAEYQRRLRDACDTSEEARRTRDWLERAVAAGEAMHCPTCRVVLMKKWGCDWLRCSVCRTEICWVTRGPRWGPLGKGDTSAGCRCGLDGTKCHPKCNYCH